MSDLPPGWEWTTLGEIATSVKNGIFVSRPGAEPNGVPILRISAVRPGELLTDDVRYSEKDEQELAAADALLVPGDLLFTRYNGNVDYVGACALVPRDLGPLTYPDKLIRVRVDSRIVDSTFVSFLCSAPMVREQVRALARTTAGQAGISGSSLRAVRLPLPPLAEQHRIVTVLESYLEPLAAWVDGVHRITRRIERFERSVVDYVASGSVSGVVPPALSREISVPAGLTELVNGWRWATIDELVGGRRGAVAIGPFGSSLKVSDYTTSGVPLVFVRNIRSGRFTGDGAKFVAREKADELASHLAQEGDVLVTKMGDPPGDACVYPESVPAVITADCIRIRLAHGWRPAYIALAINSTLVRRQIELITRGVAQRKVSLERFRSSVRIPVPPEHLQDQCIQVAERLLSLARQTREVIASNGRRAVNLRNSLLVEAFAGRLVEQDPADEPASELLARIRAQRVVVPKQRGRRTGKELAAPATRAIGTDFQQGELPL